MKIVADSNIAALDDTFGHHGELVVLGGRDICRSDLIDAGVLLVRSVTQVDEDLLTGTNIRFVGSTTIGIDHLDTAWLHANGIAWANAPGCNANAAAQYTLAMMWLACDRLGKDFSQQSVGIIGRGNVGSRLAHLLKVLNIPVMCCDPPLQEKGERNLVSMDEVCNNTIISLHVPLTTDGPHPTKNLFDEQRLAHVNSKTLLVNASRGGVIDGHGLLRHLQSAHIYAALDVWPDEPYISPELLDLVTVATPHVAGYSREGKLTGTSMIYTAFCTNFGISVGDEASDIETRPLEISSTIPVKEGLRHLVLSISKLERDDKALRTLSPVQADDSRVHIDSLRSAYPERHEFKSYSINGVSDTVAGQLHKLGFNTG
jgi:erythronate-4-phosphate dehydrogenase